ncbi:MAG TPA: FAD-dependent oxidoreductase, partial [Clostridiaceae bacterium]|nr:FAD-dependent oxidoreductase [Clostridiaceae bacterium]
MRIVVVGGVAGGATAIARLRRLDEKAEIILLEKGKYVSFANCGLPYYVGGVIARRDALFVTTAENIEAKYNIDIRTENEVTKIDAQKKQVLVKDWRTGGEYWLSYDKLLLSTGSRPVVPPLPGIDSPGVFTLWSVPDVDADAAHVAETKPRHAVVVGGGFIGLEMAENLVERGISVTLVEMADQVMASVDADMAKLVANHLIHKGIKVMLGAGLAAIEDEGKTVRLMSGDTIDTDMVLLAIGVRPNSEIARDAGLALTNRGGIQVDRNMQTSDPDIYAVGDVIGVKDFVLRTDTMIPLAGPANKQGRAVAANILKQKPEPYDGTMGTGIARVFDLTVAGVGMNEKALARAGYTYKKDYYVSIIHPMSHAGYYPGALPMTLKLIYGVDRRVLGAQIVGYDGVDKRIDTIATAIHFKASVDDLSQLELAYAPPYSSAKDPVNFAGYTAVNVLDGLSDPVTYAEWQADPDSYRLLDIREDAEAMAQPVPDAVHIPLTVLRTRLGELQKESHYLVFCAVGLRGYVAERILKANGFHVSNLVGGLRTMTDLASSLDDPELPGSVPQATDQDKIVNQEEDAMARRVEMLDVCGL